MQMVMSSCLPRRPTRRRLYQTILLEAVVACWSARHLLLLLGVAGRDFALMVVRSVLQELRLLVSVVDGGFHHVCRRCDVVHLVEAGPFANLRRAESLGGAQLMRIVGAMVVIVCCYCR